MFLLGSFNSDFLYILLSLVALVMAMFVAIPFHEFAHAWAAKHEGDYTAVAMKRYTLAPLAHFDLKGFIFLMVFGFGWAKPVPVDSRNFKHGRRSEFLVAIAGVLMNLVLGILFLFIYMLLLKFFPQIFEVKIYGLLLQLFLIYAYSLNFTLAFFNILPIYPLDGYNIVKSLSKTDNAYLSFMRRYSFFVLLIFIFTGLFDLYYIYTSELVMDLFVKLFKLILRL